MLLDDLKLGENLNKIFAPLITARKFPHAILLDGGSEELRSELSLILSASMICEGALKPCGECGACKKALDNKHPDIITIKGEKKGNKSIHISAIRELRSAAYILPNEADKKIFIIEYAEQMNIEAQNAFLKILEEPPEFVNFILLCESKSPLLETVQSRVTAYNLGAAQDEGAINSNDEVYQTAEKIVLALCENNEFSVVKACADFEKNKDLLKSVFPCLKDMFRRSLLYANGYSETDNPDKCVKKAAQCLSEQSLIKMIEQTEKLIALKDKNVNNNLLIALSGSLLFGAIAK